MPELPKLPADRRRLPSSPRAALEPAQHSLPFRRLRAPYEAGRPLRRARRAGRSDIRKQSTIDDPQDLERAKAPWAETCQALGLSFNRRFHSRGQQTTLAVLGPGWNGNVSSSFPCKPCDLEERMVREAMARAGVSQAAEDGPGRRSRRAGRRHDALRPRIDERPFRLQGRFGRQNPDGSRASSRKSPLGVKGHISIAHELSWKIRPPAPGDHEGGGRPLLCRPGLEDSEGPGVQIYPVG